MVLQIGSERLSLRPMTRSDVELLVDLDSDGEVMRYITGKPSTPEDATVELENSLGTRWLVFDQPGSFLGWVGAVPAGDGAEYDIGWRFRRAYWGNGYATEAAGALVDALFVSDANRVFAQTMAVNQRSRSVMERVGLRYARTFHLEFEDPLPGTELGEVEYELTRGAWETGHTRARWH